MKVYPHYKDTTLKEVYKTLSIKNQKLITSFLRYCEITAGQSSITKIQSKIIQIADAINKPLDSLTLEDIREFLALINQSPLAIATKNDIKKTLKRFVKWKYKGWSSKFQGLKDIKLNSKEGRKLTKEDLLTPQEMELIIKSTDSLKYKTILLLMQETANRPEELLKLKWKDINLDKGEVKLDSAKTGELRHIPINKSVEHLKRYKLESFYETPKAEDYLFPSSHNPKKHLTPQGLSVFLNNLERKIKFHKHLYPYLWRHSILSICIKKLSPKAYEMFSGHSLEMGMETYAHLDTEDLREELFSKVYNIKEITPQEREEFAELKKQMSEFKTSFQKEIVILVKELNSDITHSNKEILNKLGLD